MKIKWNDKLISECLSLKKQGKTYVEISNILNIKIGAITSKIYKLNFQKKNNNNNLSEITCACCQKKFKDLISNNRKFCSLKCSGFFYKKNKNVNSCLNCNKPVTWTYCDNTCLAEYNLKNKFNNIKQNKGKFSSRIYKKYLISIYGEKCMKCGWAEINKHTNKIPIELEHKDGNHENNKLDNLELLCPNCHSLTSTYKNLNKGNGRHSRRLRYKEGKSF